MDPIFPLAMIAAIAGAVALGWHAVRPRPSLPQGRTSWTLLLGFCPRRVYSCPMVDDFREGRDACSRCGNHIDRMDPLSRYQVDGRGTGLKLDPDGPLISSLCHGAWETSKDRERLPQGERHAPIFDLDAPATLMSLGRGGHLVVRASVTMPAYAATLKLMERFGLVLPGSAFDVETHMTRRPHGIRGYRAQGVDVLSEAVFPLIVPAKLIPSSTEGHFHLYLETEMVWEDYLSLMRSMVEAGLLEKGWVDMSERRKMAMLRKPGIKKGATQVHRAESPTGYVRPE